MRALVTGGRGFAGRWLAKHLGESGDEVVVVDAEVDVTDGRAVDEALGRAAPEAVYHLAARTHVGESWSAPLDVLGVNVLGTAAVVEAARRHAPDAVVLVVSSAEVYGAPGSDGPRRAGAAGEQGADDDAIPLTESSPVRPLSPYAASKAAAEQVALQAWRARGQHVVVVRPFNHIGPGQAPTFAVPALAGRIVEARHEGASSLRVGTLTTRRDFTDVRDVVAAYRLLVEHGRPGAVYNVCSGRSVAMSEVVERLMAICGVSLELEVDPALVRPADVPVLVGDPALVREETGWAPRLSLEDSLRDVVAELEGRGSSAAALELGTSQAPRSVS